MVTLEYSWFCLFLYSNYICLNYSPGWLIATWQLTIICGLLLAPLFYEYVQLDKQLVKVEERISWRSVSTSSVMVFGVVLVQIPQITSIEMQTFILSVVPLVIGVSVILW